MIVEFTKEYPIPTLGRVLVGSRIDFTARGVGQSLINKGVAKKAEPKRKPGRPKKNVDSELDGGAQDSSDRSADNG